MRKIPHFRDEKFIFVQYNRGAISAFDRFKEFEE